MAEVSVSAWAMIPFVIMLLAIALVPIFAEKWWESNRNKLIVSLVLGIPIAIYMGVIGLGHTFAHQMIFDYIPFIVLLGALFVITGGIHISGDMEAKPIVNTAFLGIGYILASIMGTTGAAMLLIRPLIETNKQREYKAHTIMFFIGAVANCGGLLTPLGDPPLFMLYLKGAPFSWFFQMFPEWAFAGVMLLLIYFIVDSILYKKEKHENIAKDKAQKRPLRISGAVNFAFLAGVVCAVAFVNVGTIPAMADGPIYMKFLREIVLVLLTIGSLLATPKQVRTDNKFSWAPIIEVAVLFLGIFATMSPALLFLQENASSLGLDKPWQFVYATGLLSSFLDNCPTALAFHSVALGLPESVEFAAQNMGADGVLNGITFVAGVPETLLKAISMGAVFFGAMTYIGNGPNFMVKAIAEENHIKMPSFFGYMIKFSLIVLLPIYIITQLLFV